MYSKLAKIILLIPILSGGSCFAAQQDTGSGPVEVPTPLGDCETPSGPLATHKRDIPQPDAPKKENKVGKYQFRITTLDKLIAAAGAALPFIAFTNFSTHAKGREGLDEASLFVIVVSTCICEFVQCGESDLPEGQKSKHIHLYSLMYHYFFATVIIALVWLKIPKKTTLV